MLDGDMRAHRLSRNSPEHVLAFASFRRGQAALPAKKRLGQRFRLAEASDVREQIRSQSQRRRALTNYLACIERGKRFAKAASPGKSLLRLRWRPWWSSTPCLQGNRDDL